MTVVVNRSHTCLFNVGVPGGEDWLQQRDQQNRFLYFHRSLKTSRTDFHRFYDGQSATLCHSNVRSLGTEENICTRRENVTGGWRKYNEMSYFVYYSPNIRMMKSRTRWDGIGAVINTYNLLLRNLKKTDVHITYNINTGVGGRQH